MVIRGDSDYVFQRVFENTFFYTNHTQREPVQLDSFVAERKPFPQNSDNEDWIRGKRAFQPTLAVRGIV